MRAHTHTQVEPCALVLGRRKAARAARRADASLKASTAEVSLSGSWSPDLAAYSDAGKDFLEAVVPEGDVRRLFSEAALERAGAGKHFQCLTIHDRCVGKGARARMPTRAHARLRARARAHAHGRPPLRALPPARTRRCTKRPDGARCVICVELTLPAEDGMDELDSLLAWACALCDATARFRMAPAQRERALTRRERLAAAEDGGAEKKTRAQRAHEEFYEVRKRVRTVDVLARSRARAHMHARTHVRALTHSHTRIHTRAPPPLAPAGRRAPQGQAGRDDARAARQGARQARQEAAAQGGHARYGEVQVGGPRGASQATQPHVKKSRGKARRRRATEPPRGCVCACLRVCGVVGGWLRACAVCVCVLYVC